MQDQILQHLHAHGPISDTSVTFSTDASSVLGTLKSLASRNVCPVKLLFLTVR